MGLEWTSEISYGRRSQAFFGLDGMEVRDRSNRIWPGSSLSIPRSMRGGGRGISEVGKHHQRPQGLTSEQAKTAGKQWPKSALPGLSKEA